MHNLILKYLNGFTILVKFNKNIYKDKKYQDLILTRKLTKKKKFKFNYFNKFFIKVINK